MPFIIAHQVAFALIASTLLHEFIAGSKWIKGNSLGQVAYNYVDQFLSSKSAQAGK